MQSRGGIKFPSPAEIPIHLGFREGKRELVNAFLEFVFL